MTDVTATQSAATQNTAAKADNATEKKSGPAISSDFQTFLTMLTAQMQNQDPLNPIESADYAVQLATFSGVEQQVQTNKLLEAMSANMQAGGLQALSGWIGREAPATGDITFSGDPKTLSIKHESNATRVAVSVYNENNQMIDRFDVPLNKNTYEWHGLTANGSPLPSGKYHFETTTWKGTVPLSQADTPVFQKIVEVRASDNGGELVFENGKAVTASEIGTLRQAS